MVLAWLVNFPPQLGKRRIAKRNVAHYNNDNTSLCSWTIQSVESKKVGKLVRIAVCDDDKKDLQEILYYLKEERTPYFFERNTSAFLSYKHKNSTEN